MNELIAARVRMYQLHMEDMADGPNRRSPVLGVGG